MKVLYFLCLSLLMASFARTQEKPPEIANDFISISAGDTVTVNVMENDWGMEGHTISIYNVYHGAGGSATAVDSSVTYTSYFNYGGTDTVRYILIDEDNLMLSEAGKLVIEVNNKGRANLDVNNINAFIQSFGFQFCEIGADGYIPSFEVPKGSKRQSIFVFGLWLGALDDNNGLHLAAERYRSSGMDYWNGPVSETYLNQQIIDYNRVWDFTPDDIEYHRQNWWQSGYEPSNEIATWPAYGDEALGQAEYLAPFNDRNDDGEYLWENGDYPAIRGDQGAFFIYNDDFGDHTESDGEKLKVEVQGQAYAFDCPNDSVFNNTIFMHYDIISRSALDYHDFYVSPFADFDLGYAWDDYLGCDTSLNAFYVYNGDDYDQDDTVISYVPVYGYRETPPAQAIVFLNHPMNSFMGFYNYSGPTGDPYGAEEMFNTMKGLWKDGSPITVGGNGVGGEITTKYLYPGTPSDPDGWSEYTNGNDPDDRRGVSSAGPFDLASGDTISLDLAFVFARDYTGSNVGSVDLVKERIEQLRWYFDNDSTPCGKAWTGNNKIYKEDHNLVVYPNPASNWIIVETDGNTKEYNLSDISGRMIESGIFELTENKLNVARLKKGIYFLSVKGSGRIESCKLIIK